MKDLIRTTDPVLLSFVGVLLKDAGIMFEEMDTHMSVVEGSLGILPRRICVRDEDWSRALKLLDEAGVTADR